jgi:hypothetical protein
VVILMPDSPRPKLPRTLTVHSGIVIPVIDNGDHRTVGLMSYAGSHGLDEVVVLMTAEEARHIAAELIDYANRSTHPKAGNHEHFSTSSPKRGHS